MARDSHRIAHVFCAATLERIIKCGKASLDRTFVHRGRGFGDELGFLFHTRQPRHRWIRRRVVRKHMRLGLASVQPLSVRSLSRRRFLQPEHQLARMSEEHLQQSPSFVLNCFDRPRSGSYRQKCPQSLTYRVTIRLWATDRRP